jgi:PH-interacting protein
MLEFTDRNSAAFGKKFKITLPELLAYPDFLVERTRYETSIDRNWTHRDKCLVWWRNEDEESGSWWEGRIMAVKPKSPNFPDSPWERYSFMIHSCIYKIRCLYLSVLVEHNSRPFMKEG